MVGPRRSGPRSLRGASNRGRQRRAKLPGTPASSVPIPVAAEPAASPETSDEGLDGLLVATLVVRMRKEKAWTARFSMAHPDVTMEILNHSDLGPHVSVSDHWISGSPPGVWTREIANYSDVRKVESIAEIAEGSLYRITYSNPPVIYLFRKLGVPLQFPVRIQAGTIRWEIVARRSEFLPILEFARKVDPNLQVVSIRRRPLRSHLPQLTDSQHELLTHAIEAGYFAVPREITLTELAKRLNRSKSALSEAIATIERKLLESALRRTTLTP